MSQEDLKYSAELRAHALRVMGAVEKVISRLDEPEKLETLLHELCRSHVMYDARVEYIDVSISVQIDQTQAGTPLCFCAPKCRL